MEITKNNLTFIIVTFKSSKVIIDCLNSLPREFPKLIVENSSDKDLKKKLEQNYDNLKVILSNNIGMGPGNNIGIKECKTDYVYIINPDVRFKNNTMNELISSIKNINDFAILSPISNKDQYPNYKLDSNNFNLEKNILPVKEIDGYSMIINKKKFVDQNFFDENFFMYLENVDLCFRKKNEGEKIFIVKNSKIEHLGAKAVDEKYFEETELSRNWHWMWSKFYFNKKHYGFFLALFKIFFNFSSSFFKYFFYLITLQYKKKNIYKMRLCGLLNSILGKKSWYRPKIN